MRPTRVRFRSSDWWRLAPQLSDGAAELICGAICWHFAGSNLSPAGRSSRVGGVFARYRSAAPPPSPPRQRVGRRSSGGRQLGGGGGCVAAAAAAAFAINHANATARAH